MTEELRFHQVFGYGRTVDASEGLGGQVPAIVDGFCHEGLAGDQHRRVVNGGQIHQVLDFLQSAIGTEMILAPSQQSSNGLHRSLPLVSGNF